MLLGGTAPAVLAKRMRWPWVLASATVVAAPLGLSLWALFALVHGAILVLAAASPAFARRLPLVLAAVLGPCALLFTCPSPPSALEWLLGSFNLLVGVAISHYAAPQLTAFVHSEAAQSKRSLGEQIASSAVATLWPVMVIALLALVYAGWRFEFARRTAALELRGEQAASLVLDHLSEHQRAVLHAAVDARPPARPPILDGIDQSYTGFLTLLVTDAEGQIIDFRAPWAASALPSVADRNYFREPRRTGLGFVSPVFRGRGFGNDILIAVSAPYRDARQQFAGVVQGSLSLAFLAERLRRIAAQHGLHLVLADGTATVVLSTLDAPAALDPAHGPIIEAGRALLQLNLNHAERHALHSSTVPGFGWTVHLLEPMAPLARIQSVSFALTGSAVLLGLLLLGWRARRFAEPFAKPLREMVSRVREVDLGVPSTLKPLQLRAASSEFAALAEDFNAMLQRLRDLNEDLRRSLEAQAGLNRELEERVQQRTADLAAALTRAERLAEAKTRFLSHMSHELRTPLTAILGFAEQALLASGDAARKVQALEVVVRNGRHLLSIVNDVLDAARIDAGQLAVVLEPCAPLALVEDVHALLAPAARQRSLSLNLNCHWPLPATVESDPLRLRQVLINLVGNALKFTERGGVSVDIVAVGERLSIKVRDSGIGISAEQLERLFKPFEQADDAVTRRFGGSGLGLFISKRLLEAMGGELDVESTPGHGSCFSIRLPVAAEVAWIDSRPSVTDAPAEVLAIPRLSGRVLVVDDVEDLRDLITQTLLATGVECTTATNGAEAVEQALATPVDLILMDKHMPVLDGRAAMRQLRESGYSGAIVALSADVLGEEPVDGHSVGFNAVLAKPVDRSKLYEALVRFLPPEPTAVESAQQRAVQAAFAQIRVRFRARLLEEGEALLRAADAGDTEDLKLRLHTLKGSAGTFGFAAVSAAAAEAESELKRKPDTQPLDGLLTVLLGALRAAASEGASRDAAL
jgi:signal transduction histidine kinase/DNA-binding NarL/FixJ family response regulator